MEAYKESKQFWFSARRVGKEESIRMTPEGHQNLAERHCLKGVLIDSPKAPMEQDYVVFNIQK